jgi:hypothetical protein
VWWIRDCEARNGTSVSSLSSSIMSLGGMLRDESGGVAMLAAVAKRLEISGTGWHQAGRRPSGSRDANGVLSAG